MPSGLTLTMDAAKNDEGHIEGGGSASRGVQMASSQSHPLFESRPNFTRALQEFKAFLALTLEDLEAKLNSLKAQKKLVKQKAKVRNYLSCQTYMLKKHIKRLKEFESEIDQRLESILAPDEAAEAEPNTCTANRWILKKKRLKAQQESIIPEVAPSDMENCGVATVLEEEDLDFREAAIDCEGLEADYGPRGRSKAASNPQQPSDEEEDEDIKAMINDADEYLKEVKKANTGMAESKSRSSSILGDSLSDVSQTQASPKDAHLGKVIILNNNPEETTKGAKNHPNPQNHPKDEQLLKLLADMTKMKRRCKHILDVTDKYCVLNSLTDLKLDCTSTEVESVNRNLAKTPAISHWTSKGSFSGCPSSALITEVGSTSSPEGSMPSSPSSINNSGPEGLPEIAARFCPNIQDQPDGSSPCCNQNSPTKLPSSISDKGIVRITFQSLGSHLSVIAKTYVKRHAQEPTSTPLVFKPGSVQPSKTPPKEPATEPDPVNEICRPMMLNHGMIPAGPPKQLKV